MKLFPTPIAIAVLTVVSAFTVMPDPVHAQSTGSTTRAVAMPRITAFDVKSVDRVEAGTELEFAVWGTPGATASLQIEGARRPLVLTEVNAGRYEGTYTVSRSDRIAPQSKVTANLRSSNLVSTAVLSEPLQNGWPSPVAADATARIDMVDATIEPSRRRWNNTVRYTLKGTPGGSASVQIDGSQPSTLTLQEVRPGEYTGVYTVPPGQWIATDRGLTGRLRVGERTVVSTSADAYADVKLDAAPAQRRAETMPANCVDCGHVEAINRIEVDGNGKVIGTVAGTVLGAVIGNQVGKGDGRTAARVVGAIGGGLIGREVGGRNSARTQYEVVVLTPSGERRTVHFADAPSFKVGDAVRIVGDSLEPWRA